MATKKKISRPDNCYGDVPTKLSSFYGLTLDDEQTAFRDAIWDPDIDIVFCDAIAGTGKTTVALGTANLLVKYGRYQRIVLIMAPTATAKSGFLPGEIDKKMAPYFAPLYDVATSLDINPYRDVNLCTEDMLQPGDGYIDCMSQMFLRGRNIGPDTVLWIDEAQNCYLDELKTILTRVHDGAKVIVTGHTGQCDLYHHPENSGFAPYLKHFQGKPRCEVCHLTNNHRGWVSRWADAIT